MHANNMEGVNHYHSHFRCRLAKFRDLMYRVKYGAVIGSRNFANLYELSLGFQVMGFV